LMRWIRLAAINLVVLLAILVAIEGLASAFLVARDVTVLAWVASPYSEYDADLGWIGRRSVNLPDIFGKGVGVRTNDQRFRATDTVAPHPAAGRIRVVCTGDSFTFGDGVDNAHTWCQQLASRDSRIEPVNLGQGGYGIDQAYLRFLRDTRGIEHQVHLFA